MGRYDISVIVPVYNAEKYLKQCIDSILAQSKDNIEIIIVDDGSTDASPQIIDNYSANNERIRVIHQENMGVGTARANGIDASSGTYIGWVDADDLIKSNMFETLYQLAQNENADYVYCDYDYFPERVTTKSKWFKEYKGVRDGEFIDRNTQCWNTLVRKDLYEKVNITQLLKEFGEYSWIAAMIHAKKIAFTRNKLYLYRVGHESLSGGRFEGRVKYYRKCVELSKNLKKIIHNTKYEEQLDTYFDYRYIYSLFLLLLVAARNNDKTEYDNAKEELNKMKYKNNPYLSTFVSNSYGFLKSFVIIRIMPLNYFVANKIARAAL